MSLFIFVLISAPTIQVKDANAADMFKKLFGGSYSSFPDAEEKLASKPEDPFLEENRKLNDRYFQAVESYKKKEHSIALAQLKFGHQAKEPLSSLALAELYLFGLSPSSEVTFAALSRCFALQRSPLALSRRCPLDETLGLASLMKRPLYEPGEADFLPTQSSLFSFPETLSLDAPKGFEILKNLSENSSEAQLVLKKLKLVKASPSKKSEKFEEKGKSETLFYPDPITDVSTSYPMAAFHRAAIAFTLDYFTICSPRDIKASGLKNYHLYEGNPFYVEALQQFGLIEGLKKTDFSMGMRLMTKAIQEKFPPALLMRERLSKEYTAFIKDLEANADSTSFKLASPLSSSTDESKDTLTLGDEGFLDRYLYDNFAAKMKKKNKFHPFHCKLLSFSVYQRLGALKFALNTNLSLLSEKEKASEYSLNKLKKDFVGAGIGFKRKEGSEEYTEYAIFESCLISLPALNFEVERAWEMIMALDKE